MKVTTNNWYAENSKMYRDYLMEPSSLPPVLLEIPNPKHKKFWFRAGGRTYRCFCFCHGQWWEFKELQDGFYEFHVPTILRSMENYKEFQRMQATSPELFKAFLPKVRKDVDFWFMVDSGMKIRFDTRKRHLSFCKNNKIVRTKTTTPLPLP